MQVLVAEDDSETAQFIADGLERGGHEVIRADDGWNAARIALTEPVDVVILDRMLPRLDGIAVLRRMRDADIRTPVLMLTALGRLGDRVEGLDAGADDYLVKPFAGAELLARVNALGRRHAPPTRQTGFAIGDLAIDLLTREVRRGDRAIALQPREFQLLAELMRESGRIVTRVMLLERVWGFTFDPQTNIVETHMSRMRAKLNDGGGPDPIETVRGVGYRMRIAAAA